MTREDREKAVAVYQWLVEIYGERSDVKGMWHREKLKK